MVSRLAWLHQHAGEAIPFDAPHVWAGLARMIASRDCLALVSDKGLLVGSIGPTTISPALVAVEHAWIGGGEGRALAAEFEAWARGRGAVATRMACHPGDERACGILERLGFEPAELHYQKAL